MFWSEKLIINGLFCQIFIGKVEMLVNTTLNVKSWVIKTFHNVIYIIVFSFNNCLFCLANFNTLFLVFKNTLH